MCQNIRYYIIGLLNIESIRNVTGDVFTQSSDMSQTENMTQSLPHQRRK